MKLKNILFAIAFIAIVFSCKTLWDSNTEKQTQETTVTCKIPYYNSGALISHNYYTLQYSEQHEQARWVAYKLFPEFLIKNAKRKNNFKTDPKILTGSATLKDYKNSGFDRGHLAPAGAMVANQNAMDESFYMSNMSPQVAGFNRGVWKHLEEQVRTWARKKDSLFVVTGPILKNIEKHIGPNNVSVPKKYYKVLLSFKNKQSSGIAFLLDNTSSKDELHTFAISIDSIEKLTGIDFNPNLNSVDEKTIEGKVDLSEWEF